MSSLKERIDNEIDCFKSGEGYRPEIIVMHPTLIQQYHGETGTDKILGLRIIVSEDLLPDEIVLSNYIANI